MEVIIFSRVPYEVFYLKEFVDKSKVIILTDRKIESDYLLNGFKNVYSFDNYITNSEVLLTAIKLCQKHKIELIYSMDESDIERASYLREVMNIQGQKVISSIFYRDKYLMKLAVKNVIDVPTFDKVDSIEEVKHFINSTGLPVVLKPRKGWSSNKTYKIVSLNDICLLEKIDLNGYIIEEWIDNAKMYTVDGIQENGRILWSSIHEYDNNILESISNANEGYSMVTSEIMNDIKEVKEINMLTQKIINVLNNNELFKSPFHFELFKTNKNKFVFCEIASRFGGGKTLDLIKNSYKINLAEIFFEFYNGKNINFSLINNAPIKYSACIKIFGNKHIPQDNSWIIKRFSKNKKEHILPQNTNDISHLYLIEGDSYIQCIDRIKNVYMKKEK